MEHLRLIRDIEMRNQSSVYLLHGEEAYFTDIIANALEEKLLDESEKAFGLNILYGKDSTLEQILSISKGFPMGGNLQLVIVREAQELKDWKKEDQTKRLIDYINSPTPTTVLAFCYKNGKLDGRSQIFKAFKSKAKVFESTKIKEYALPDWIQGFVKEKKLTISGSNTQLLADYLGSDLHKLVNEIEKLLLILKPGEEITSQIIQDHIGISKDYNVWELQDALVMKDVLKANRIIHYFENNPKQHPVAMIIPALYPFFAKLCLVLNSSNKSEAYQELGISSFALRNYKEAEKNYSPAKSERIIGYLRDAEEQLKGVKGLSFKSGDILKELIFKILH
ncbi:MAG: DNA polymerase III subunit delta [Bacteroidota bacterium]|jgi:DNA polymerase III subunit delta